jgi:far upstream element-binding protein
LQKIKGFTVFFVAKLNPDPNFNNMSGYEELSIPDNFVGMVIGRGGENIKRIQMDSGCQVKISSDNNGTPYRSCQLTGTPESIEIAKGIIQDVINRGPESGGNRGGFQNGGNRGGYDRNQNQNFGGNRNFGGNNFGGQDSLYDEVDIPEGFVGMVIGRGGENIKRIQMESGCKVKISSEGNGTPYRSCQLTGSQESIDEAKRMVQDVVSRGQSRENRN